MFRGSVASQDIEEVVRALKSAAEPSRLRLLCLLSAAEYTVGELCTILGQSQPRISRHLRLLTEAGLLDRFREQQCVYYRMPVAGRYSHWVRQVLSMADPDANVLKRDRERALRVVGDRARVAQQQVEADELAPREDLASVLREVLGPTSVGELLDIGTGHGLMLEILGPMARHAVGVDICAPALRLARTRVHGAGLAHVEFRRGDMYRLPFDDASFDTVTIHRVLASAERPGAAIGEVARILRPDGRLLVVEDFDLIDARGGSNPLSALRRWFDAAGMSIGHLRPCDLGGRHFIIAFGRHASSASQLSQPQQQAGLA
ncbi:MAG TPA: metalloregulator ArsR/SmtB family transcription factor [Steroidobacteraceae bacterium]|nr:metalloregulator ArsR/SmtB family transcription factor [Steroidobacteraceae bacterium]